MEAAMGERVVIQNVDERRRVLEDELMRNLAGIDNDESSTQVETEAHVLQDKIEEIKSEIKEEIKQEIEDESASDPDKVLKCVTCSEVYKSCGQFDAHLQNCTLKSLGHDYCTTNDQVVKKEPIESYTEMEEDLQDTLQPVNTLDFLNSKMKGIGNISADQTVAANIISLKNNNSQVKHVTKTWETQQKQGQSFYNRIKVGNKVYLIPKQAHEGKASSNDSNMSSILSKSIVLPSSKNWRHANVPQVIRCTSTSPLSTSYPRIVVIKKKPTGTSTSETEAFTQKYTEMVDSSCSTVISPTSSSINKPTARSSVSITSTETPARRKVVCLVKKTNQIIDQRTGKQINVRVSTRPDKTSDTLQGKVQRSSSSIRPMFKVSHDPIVIDDESDSGDKRILDRVSHETVAVLKTTSVQKHHAARTIVTSHGLPSSGITHVDRSSKSEALQRDKTVRKVQQVEAEMSENQTIPSSRTKLSVNSTGSVAQNVSSQSSSMKTNGSINSVKNLEPINLVNCKVDLGINNASKGCKNQRKSGDTYKVTCYTHTNQESMHVEEFCISCPAKHLQSRKRLLSTNEYDSASTAVKQAKVVVDKLPDTLTNSEIIKVQCMDGYESVSKVLQTNVQDLRPVVKIERADLDDIPYENFDETVKRRTINYGNYSDNGNQDVKRSICHVCGKLFENIAEYVDHSIACRPTDSENDDKNAVHEQIQTVDMNSNASLVCMICGNCGQNFSELNAFTLHTDKCSQLASSRDRPQPEVNEFDFTVENGHDYTCPNCNEMYDDHPQFMNHITECGQRLRCEDCGKVFPDAGDLFQHGCIIRQEASTWLMQDCPRCFLSFPNFSELNNHNCSAVSKKRCRPCGKIFDSENAYKDHVCVPKYSFTCGMCGKSFEKKHVLKGHMKIHAGMKEFKCVTCDRAFYHKHQLKNHMNMHSQERNFTCTVCDNKYKFVSNLQKHMLAAHNEDRELFKCSYCDAKLSSNYHRKRHEQLHFDRSRDWKCEFCSAMFYRKEQCVIHIKRVHNRPDRDQVSRKIKREKACKYCDKKFYWSKHFRQHMKLVHEDHEFSDAELDDDCIFVRTYKNTNNKTSKMSNLRKTRNKYSNNHYSDYSDSSEGEDDKKIKLVDSSSGEDENDNEDWEKKVMENLKKKGNFKCQECERVFRSQGNLDRHMSFIHDSEGINEHQETEVENAGKRHSASEDIVEEGVTSEQSKKENHVDEQSKEKPVD